MAVSPSHQLGEMIGFLLEETVIDYLKPLVPYPDYYLDYKHPRQARNGKNEVRHTDAQGNTHKLDIVIEKSGTENRFGDIVAFIEVAWRRYVKHSKNKAQEISGAILPLVEKYKLNIPFQGTVLAGEWTNDSLKQLESEGFTCHCIKRSEIVSAFKSAIDLDIDWEENTPEDKLAELAKKVSALTQEQQKSIKKQILSRNRKGFAKLAKGLKITFSRRLSSITITPLHGISMVASSVEEAVTMLQKYDEQGTQQMPFIRYQLTILYSNGESIVMTFLDKASAIRMLRSFIA